MSSNNSSPAKPEARLVPQTKKASEHLPARDALVRARAWSAALDRRLLHDQDFKAWLEHASQVAVTPSRIQSWFEELAQGRTLPLEETDCRQVLRELRQRVFHTLVIRDINGLASVNEVTQAMTHLADLAITEATLTATHTLATRHGRPIGEHSRLPQEMIVVAMGKAGGRELNVSSDIDLIMLYDEDGQTDGARSITVQEFLVRVTRLLISILSEPDAHGIVFRTDLRLRPDGDSSPLVWRLRALEKYLKTQGREWERYAWLKARVIRVQAWPDSAPRNALHELERLRRPFVYRKYLDFDALAALRELRERIRDDWTRRASHRSGVDAQHNIKLGDGGIREIEFVVQLNQLIRGGNMPALQKAGLLPALASQKRAGVIPSGLAQHLEEAYLFLRRLEHFLQYREDEQTHLLPPDEETFDRLAQALAMTPEALAQTLQRHRRHVETIFNNAFRVAGVPEDAAREVLQEPTDSVSDEDRTVHTLQTDPARRPRSHSKAMSKDGLLEQYGEDRAQVASAIEAFLASHRVRRLNAPGRKRIEALLSPMLAAALDTPQPATTFVRLLNLVESVAQRSAYLALLTEYPMTLPRAAMLMGASPWAAQYILSHPIVLNRLIDWDVLMQEPDFKQISETLRADLEASVLPDGQPDVENQMNLMRDLHHQVTFQLLAQDLSGVLTVERLADHLSALADLILAQTLHCTWQIVRQRAPHAPEEPAFAIIAYGKLGSKELGYASDLDLVFLYDDPDDDDAFITYARLVSRLTSWLSTLTSSGRLYAVDLRLRPEGDAGLQVSSLSAFEHYQHHQAWVWEHQALTRARFVAGDAAIGKRFEDIRTDILRQSRDPQELASQVKDMRAKISEGHRNTTESFDLKHDDGGMVYLEFITQYLVLLHARDHPSLVANLGNNALLKLCGELGLVDAHLVDEAIAAYQVLRRHQHALRLQGNEHSRQDSPALERAREAVQILWDSVFST